MNYDLEISVQTQGVAVEDIFKSEGFTVTSDDRNIIDKLTKDLSTELKDKKIMLKINSVGSLGNIGIIAKDHKLCSIIAVVTTDNISNVCDYINQVLSGIDDIRYNQSSFGSSLLTTDENLDLSKFKTTDEIVDYVVGAIVDK